LSIEGLLLKRLDLEIVIPPYYDFFSGACLEERPMMGFVIFFLIYFAFLPSACYGYKRGIVMGNYYL